MSALLPANGSHQPARILGVGDNVLDCYLDQDLAYPGGNALNVAVYARLLHGLDSGYLGICGTDRFADHLLRTMDELAVDTTRVRRAVGPNGMAFVELGPDGDRHFVGSNRGGVQAELRLRLQPADLAYAAGFDLVHTSVYSALEPELPTLAKRGSVTFDLSTEHDPGYLARVAPHCAIVFASGAGLDRHRVDALGRALVRAGAGCAVVTRGVAGAHGYTAGRELHQGVVPVQAIDALGAGDAFISGFLAAALDGADLARALAAGADSGARACGLRGAFGYPVTAGADAAEQLNPYDALQ